MSIETLFHDAELEAAQRLALACEFRDDDTNQHAQRVGRTAALLASELGLSSDEVELIRHAAPLHDIGKIGIADSILLKPGRLRSDELAVMQTHTLIGSQILAGSRSRLLQVGETIAITHHERWDGRGYPNGLAGDDIPIAGRVTAVADVFDALNFSRPYKDAWPLDAALAEMELSAGRQLDPEIVAILHALDHDALLARVEPEDAVGAPR
ncbi:MAG: cyclic di-GMP phosphodiesterase [Thermoleophilaceae bacterium]|jgi:putative two-component system response regulator|nr:cyclic di-GMP phosphodiesterase [Thermoleophilaceae bacterium]